MTENPVNHPGYEMAFAHDFTPVSYSVVPGCKSVLLIFLFYVTNMTLTHSYYGICKT